MKKQDKTPKYLKDLFTVEQINDLLKFNGSQLLAIYIQHCQEAVDIYNKIVETQTDDLAEDLGKKIAQMDAIRLFWEPRTSNKN